MCVNTVLRTAMNVDDKVGSSRHWYQAPHNNFLEAVASSTVDEACTEWMTPQERINSGMRFGVDSCQGPSPCLSNSCNFLYCTCPETSHALALSFTYIYNVTKNFTALPDGENKTRKNIRC